MSDAFVAEIRIFAFDFAPKGWALCDGQVVPSSQNIALASAMAAGLGSAASFALPNLAGRVPMHPGQGPGLSLHDLGEEGGTETVELIESEIPNHRHTLRADTLDLGDTNVPSATASLAVSTGGALYQGTSDAQAASLALAPAGAGAPHNNLQPYLTLNFCIALQGVGP